MKEDRRNVSEDFHCETNILLQLRFDLRYFCKQHTAFWLLTANASLKYVKNKVKENHLKGVHWRLEKDVIVNHTLVALNPQFFKRSQPGCIYRRVLTLRLTALNKSTFLFHWQSTEYRRKTLLISWKFFRFYGNRLVFHSDIEQILFMVKYIANKLKNASYYVQELLMQIRRNQWEFSGYPLFFFLPSF